MAEGLGCFYHVYIENLHEMGLTTAKYPSLVSSLHVDWHARRFGLAGQPTIGAPPSLESLESLQAQDKLRALEERLRKAESRANTSYLLERVLPLLARA